MCETGCSHTGVSVCVVWVYVCVPDTACFCMMDAYMCTFSLFFTAIHHRHPEPGMVDIHSGMVRMCVLQVTCQRQLVGCPFKSVSRRLPVNVGLFTFRAAVSQILTAHFYCSCKEPLLLLYILLSIGCVSFNEVWCELFLRSVTQQLLYGLLHNSWLYQGRFMCLGTALLCGTGPV